MLAPLPGRSLLRGAAATVCVACLAMPATAGPRAELRDVKDRMRDARQGLREVEGQTQVTQDDLAQLDARVAELTRLLTRLQTRVRAAEATLRLAERRLAQTVQRFVSTKVRLHATRATLRHDREVFSDRARASFMYGGAGYGAVQLEVRTVSEFGRSLEYMRSVMSGDKEQVDRIAALEREVHVQTLRLRALRDRHSVQRAAAQRARDHARDLLAQQRAARALLHQQAAQRRAVLAQLAAQRTDVLREIENLEADSSALQERLRRAAERAAAEAAAARAAEAAERARTAARATRAAPPPAPPPPPPVPTGTGMLWPASGPMTSPFGWRIHPIYGYSRLHTGVDIGASYGSPIVAADSGTVYFSGGYGGYGNAVIIDHGGGITTLYAHQSSIAASSGQPVARGQVIGYVGSTGASTGPHLHFEVRVYGEPRDPMGWL